MPVARRGEASSLAVDRFEAALKRLPRLSIRLERSIWRILLVGLLLRLLLMPFAAHSDLMHMYWGAHLIVYHQRFTLGFEALLRYFHAGYLWLVGNLMPPTDSLWIHYPDDPLLNPFLSPQVVSTAGWFAFISQPQIYRTLFLLKLPYLFFDLACSFMLYKLGSDRTTSRFRFTFWWLNPILIFAVYIFGRHEVIAIFLILLSLYLIERGRWQGGLLALGVAIAVRYYAILLLPFYVLSMGPTWKKRFQGLIVGLAPWLVMNIVNWSIAGAPEAKGLIYFSQSNDLLSMKLQIASWDNIYLFPLAYGLLLLHRLYSREYGLRVLVQYNLIALLLLFATVYTGQSPHYWTWYLPFLAISMPEDRRLLPLHVVQIVLLIIYSFIGGRSTAGYLFASISPDFFWSLPSPLEVLERFTSPEMVISLARTAFSAVSLWMAYLVFRQIKSSYSVDPGAEGVT